MHTEVAVDAVVGHLGEGVCRKFVGSHQREVTLPDLIERDGRHIHRVGQRALAEVHKGAGILLLAIAQAIDIHIAELQIGAALAEGLARALHLLHCAARADTLQELGHSAHSVLVAVLNGGLTTREIQQRGSHFALDNHALTLGQRVIRRHRNERHNLLLNRGVLSDIFIIGHALRANEKRGLKSTLQRTPGEVIVATSIDQHTASLIRHGAEQNGVRHRGTHGKGQIATLVGDSLVAVHVGCDAAIGYHQLIEVAATRHRGGGEELVQRHIYLRGVDKGVG